MDTEDRFLDSVLTWNPEMDTAGGTDIPIDGTVEFRYPRYQDDQPDEFRPYENGYFWRMTFPYRDKRRDEHPWFRFPEEEKGKRHPIWKWENADEPLDNMTLSPSIGKSNDGEMVFHCYVRDGKIEWL